MAAHQDDTKAFHKLVRPAQLNCACDAGAKKKIYKQTLDALPCQAPFPLEPICLFVGKEKITSDTGDHIRFAAHRQLTKEVFHLNKILLAHQFEEVDWYIVHKTLRRVPRLFQIWACKQVTGIAGTFHFQSKYDKKVDPLCRSCGRCNETAEHTLFCPEAGRVDALMKTIHNMGEWLEDVGTCHDLLYCLVRYAQGRGGRTMEDVCDGLSDQFQRMAISQDKIGWRRFMEGMMSKEIAPIQTRFLRLSNSRLTIDRWGVGLVTKLLECTHGQWLYRNIVVHDRTSGDIASQRKKEIQMEVEKQQELGDNGLLREDRFLLKIKLDDLEMSSGEQEEYWLLAIRAARKACALRNQQNQPAGTEESH